MNRELLFRSIKEHRSALEAGEYSAEELTRAHLSRIEETNPVTNAFLEVDAEGALSFARASDDRRRRGECLGALDGIPFSLKDNFAARGLGMRCGSRILENFISPYDATVCERLRRGGAVLLGKNNMDEFAMGSAGEYSAYAPMRNPHDPTCSAGGSSGGSAISVAEGTSVFSLGTDTGGSVRQPAAFCGVYGLKPTYGVLSRYGVAEMASSLDCVGVLARTPQDCAEVFFALVGKDARDATSCEYMGEMPVWKNARDVMKGLRVAVVREALAEEGFAEVSGALRAAVGHFTSMGASVREVSLPSLRSALAAYTVLAAAEVASNLSRYDGIHYGMRKNADGLYATYAESRSAYLGDEAMRRILFGTDMLREENRERYYLRAERVREHVLQTMRAWMEEYDLILSPTSPTVAFPLGKKLSPQERYRADMCAVYANLSGFPAISLPFGRTEAGLPLAIQLTARPMGETLLLRVAEALRDMLGVEGSDDVGGTN